MLIDRDTLKQGLNNILKTTNFDDLGKKYTGKVRDCYSLNDNKILLITTDRISAFDQILGTIPYKGQVLNALSNFWFEKTKHIVPNHVLSVTDPNVTIGLECEPLKLEMIVRAYLTGTTSTSILMHYKNGSRNFYGHKLSDGLRDHEKLPSPIITPTTKAEHGTHDVNVPICDAIKMASISQRDFDEISDYSMALFKFGQKTCEERGLILVDTKYEFGKTKDGKIVVIDEIHTTDSSRFWIADCYEESLTNNQNPKSLDKDYIRRWLLQQGYSGDGQIPILTDEVRIEAAEKYIKSYETISGQEFVPNFENPISRITKNIGNY